MLETKIEELTKAIHLLVETINSQQTTIDQVEINNEKAEKLKAVKVEAPEQEAPEQEAQEQECVVTHSDLKELILQKSRANPDNRVKLKALLKKYSATKVTDLKADDIAEVHGLVVAGEF